MSKSILRAFASGMLITTCILGILYFYSGEPAQEQEKEAILTEENIQVFLEERNLVAINESEYEAFLRAKESQSEKTSEKEEAESPSKPEKEVVIKYTLEIKSGMTSQDIDGLLQDVGIIDNNDKLSEMITDKNLATSIQIGSFEVTSDMSVEEIVDAITR